MLLEFSALKDRRDGVLLGIECNECKVCVLPGGASKLDCPYAEPHQLICAGLLLLRECQSWGGEAGNVNCNSSGQVATLTHHQMDWLVGFLFFWHSSLWTRSKETISEQEVAM